MSAFSGFIKKKELLWIFVVSMALVITGAIIDSDPIPENPWPSMATDFLIMTAILFCLAFFIYFSDKLVYSCFAEIVDWIKCD